MGDQGTKAFGEGLASDPVGEGINWWGLPMAICIGMAVDPAIFEGLEE